MKNLLKGASVAFVFIAAILFFGGITVLGDSFVEPEPFEIWSEDGTKVFRWNLEWNESRSWVVVHARVYQNGNLLYYVENLPFMGESASNFIFSDDMRHLAFIPTTGHVAALGFFEDGVLLRSYRIDELVRDMNVVTYTVTMASWENWSGRSFDADNNALTIVTSDGITYIFDITSGEIIYDNAGNRPFISQPEGTFEFLVNAGDLPLWARTPGDEPVNISPQIWPPIELPVFDHDRYNVTNLPFPIATPPLSDPTLSSWAVEPVSAAVMRGIVPDMLKSDFNLAITREEFADLVITTYMVFISSMIGSDDAPVLEREIAERIPPFEDTDNLNVMIAAYLGLITGIGDGYFDPESNLTREQAAVILKRFVEIVLAYPEESVPPVIFSDTNQISDWAVEAVEKMQMMGIMGGVGGNQFSPQGTFTREQSIVTVMRIFDMWHHEMLGRDFPL